MLAKQMDKNNRIVVYFLRLIIYFYSSFSPFLPFWLHYFKSEACEKKVYAVVITIGTFTISCYSRFHFLSSSSIACSPSIAKIWCCSTARYFMLVYSKIINTRFSIEQRLQRGNFNVGWLLHYAIIEWRRCSSHFCGPRRAVQSLFLGCISKCS